MDAAERILGDESLQPLLREVASREAYYLLEEVFPKMQELAVRELETAEDDRALVWVQAYQKFLSGLRKRIQSYRTQPQGQKTPSLLKSHSADLYGRQR